MSILTTRMYQPHPGRFPDFVDNVAFGGKMSADAGARNYQLTVPVTAGAVSSVAIVTYEADSWAHAGAVERRARTDPRVQEAWTREGGADAAQSLTGVYAAMEIPVEGVGDAGEPLPIVACQYWHAKDGRIAESVEGSLEALAMSSRLGATNVRLFHQSIGGEETGALFSMLDFEDLEAHGRFLDASIADEELQGLAARLTGSDGPSGQWQYLLMERIPL